MLGRRALLIAVLVPALVLAACGSSAQHYSAQRFKTCLSARHVRVTITRDKRTSSTSVLVWNPTFAEWVYFFGSPAAAGAERSKLESDSPQTRPALKGLFRTQRSNVLIFAPAQADWLSPIKGCLQNAQA